MCVSVRARIETETEAHGRRKGSRAGVCVCARAWEGGCASDDTSIDVCVGVCVLVCVCTCMHACMYIYCHNITRLHGITPIISTKCKLGDCVVVFGFTNKGEHLHRASSSPGGNVLTSTSMQRQCGHIRTHAHRHYHLYVCMYLRTYVCMCDVWMQIYVIYTYIYIC